MGTPASENSQSTDNKHKKLNPSADRWVANLRRLSQKSIDGWVRLRAVNDSARVRATDSIRILEVLEAVGAVESRKAQEKTPGRDPTEVRLTMGVSS